MCMAVGKYYNQSKLNLLLRRRQIPELDYHNEDYHTLVRLQSHTTKMREMFRVPYRESVRKTRRLLTTCS